MLLQWLLRMVLSAGIILSATQGFLLLSQLHQAQLALSQEQAQLRFLVAYFRDIFHSALLPGQCCGAKCIKNGALSLGKKEEFLALQLCRHDGGADQIVLWRLWVLPGEKNSALRFFVEEGESRREALGPELKDFHWQFCTRSSSDWVCGRPDSIKEWNAVRILVLNFSFEQNSRSNLLSSLNHPRKWELSLRIGGQP